MRRTEVSRPAKKDRFRTFELALDNGNRHRITHPESYALGEDSMVVWDPSGDWQFIDYRSISEIRFPKRPNGRR